jgi:uncharacterized protein YfaA (DUF2138 family)
MALNKYSYSSDTIADVYRASLYLAKGSKNVALDFLLKSREKLGKKFAVNLVYLIKNYHRLIRSKKDQLFWAEKILDEYQKFKLSSE